MDSPTLDRLIGRVCSPRTRALVGLEVDPAGHLVSVAAPHGAGSLLVRQRVAPGEGTMCPLPAAAVRAFLQTGSPHTEVTLTLPPGTAGQRPVLIMQAGSAQQQFPWPWFPDNDPGATLQTQWTQWAGRVLPPTAGVATVAAASLRAVLRRVAPAASHDARLPAHEIAATGILARLYAPEPLLLACAGRFLAVGSLALTALHREVDLLLPVVACERFAHLLTYQEDHPVEILLSGNHTALLRCGPLEVWTRLLPPGPAAYVAALRRYQDLFPTPTTIRVQVGVRPLQAALRRLQQQARPVSKPQERVLFCQQEETRLHLALGHLGEHGPSADAPVAEVPIQTAVGQLPPTSFFSHLFRAAVQAAALAPVISLETSAAAATKPQATPWVFRSGAEWTDLGLLHPVVYI